MKRSIIILGFLFILLSMDKAYSLTSWHQYPRYNQNRHFGQYNQNRFHHHRHNFMRDRIPHRYRNGYLTGYSPSITGGYYSSTTPYTSYSSSLGARIRNFFARNNNNTPIYDPVTNSYTNGGYTTIFGSNNAPWGVNYDGNNCYNAAPNANTGARVQILD